MGEKPLIVVLQHRVGARRGGRVLAFLVAWDTAQRALGDEWPQGVSAQVDAYAEWWRQPIRTAWDEMARFREAFPEAAGRSPSEFLGELESVWDRRRGARGLGSAVLPA